MSKEVLSPINLLVISFSVINYVVRVRVHAGCVDAHFFCSLPYPHPRKSSSGGQTGQDRTVIHGKAVPVDKPGKTGRSSTERQFWWTNRARPDGHPRESSAGGQTGQDRTAIHGKAVPVDKPGLHQGDSALGLPPHLPNRRTIRKFAGRNIR